MYTSLQDARDLGLTITPGLILDTKPLASSDDGTVMEWRLLVNDEVNGTLWVPKIVHPNGKVTTPPWMALPGSQFSFLQCPIFEALYHGNRGPGKSQALIMDFAKDCGKGYGKAWRGVLFRKSFGDLEDIVHKIEYTFPLIFPGFKFLKSKSEYKAVWQTGEELMLRHMKDEGGYSEFHGQELPWIAWEELTQWENDKAYKMMMSCCRPTAPGIPCRVRATTNPDGAGHNWVKKRFQLPDMTNKVIRIPGEPERVAIKGSLVENFMLLHSAPDYPDKVRAAAKNPAQAEAWLDGSWDITSGGMIDDLWHSPVHVLPDFSARTIPREWTITRAYDHGQSHPFATGWWLESNGEAIVVNGRLIGNVRGDLILWAEWYGTSGNDNEGIRLPSKKIAEGIRDREQDMGISHRVQPGPADTEIYNKLSDRQGKCPADDMEEIGIEFERADKSAGSRKRGWEMLRTRLGDALANEDGTRERPGLFVTQRCRHWINLVPPMPRDEEDPDEVPAKYEDHCADMTRYRLNWELPGMFRRGF